MLTKEDNELLCRVGPGTPMGELMRQYWIPALLAEELPEDDCPPVRVKLLGERMIAIRDSKGRYGLMDEFCAHRGVSLWFGRNEEAVKTLKNAATILSHDVGLYLALGDAHSPTCYLAIPPSMFPDQ